MLALDGLAGQLVPGSKVASNVEIPTVIPLPVMVTTWAAVSAGSARGVNDVMRAGCVPRHLSVKKQNRLQCKRNADSTRNERTDPRQS